MWRYVKNFFKRSNYYVKINVDNEEHDIFGFNELVDLLSGQRGEVTVLNITGRVEMIVGKK